MLNQTDELQAQTASRAHAQSTEKLRIAGTIKSRKTIKGMDIATKARFRIQLDIPPGSWRPQQLFV
jgi:hypothetical protein